LPKDQNTRNHSIKDKEFSSKEEIYRKGRTLTDVPVDAPHEEQIRQDNATLHCCEDGTLKDTP
jgi:hypothetical protein